LQYRLIHYRFKQSSKFSGAIMHCNGRLICGRVSAFGQNVFSLCLITLWLSVCALAQQQPAASASSSSPDPAHLADRGPATAPVTIVEFSDFACPYCRSMAPVVKELLKSYPDKVRVVLKNSPLNIHPDSPLAHEAAYAAGAQGKFWEMHDLLFANQKNLKPADLETYAQQLGLDMEKFKAALADHRYKAQVDKDTQDADNFGVTQTPTLFINGRRVTGSKSYKDLAAILDQEIATATGVVNLKRGEVASIERAAGVTVGDSPRRGPDAAPVTIVEFTDMQCPYCSRAVPVMQELRRLYPDQVRWVFKHHPLDFHKDAPLAHRALLAAEAQGKFWEMHDAIFAGQRDMKRDGLLRKAAGIGLNMQRFSHDLDDEKLAGQLEDDQRMGTRLSVEATPTFYVNGRRFTGVLPLPAFKQLIDDEIAYAAKAKSPLVAGKPASKGPEGAPVTVEWFADLGSSYSQPAARLMARLMEEFPQKVRVVFRHDPLPIHAASRLEHEALLAAGAQGKFWEMQESLLAHAGDESQEQLEAMAGKLGLDARKFSFDLENNAYQHVIDRDVALAHEKEVRGTPVFFVNQQRMDGMQPYAALEEMVKAELGKMVSSNAGPQ
jgi:protein-disulfide isomerase